MWFSFVLVLSYGTSTEEPSLRLETRYKWAERKPRAAHLASLARLWARWQSRDPRRAQQDEFPGASRGIDSHGFDLREQPKRVVVVGAGYTAVELAGVFNQFRSEVMMLIHRGTMLLTVDPMLGETLTKRMKHTGIDFCHGSKVKKVEGGLSRGGEARSRLCAVSHRPLPEHEEPWLWNS